MKRKKDNETLSIFDFLQEQVKQTPRENPGSCAVDAEFLAALFEDLKRATTPEGHELSRHLVAARMSDLTGDEITYSMLVNWVAESHDNHNMPAKYLPAFAVATGGRRAMEVLSKKAGMFTLPGPEALRAEIRRLEESKKNTNKEILKREVLLREVESRKKQ